MKKIVILAVMIMIFAVTMKAEQAHADTLRIGIMQDKSGAFDKYKPLVNFFNSKGIDLQLQGFNNYSDAAILFEKGDVDAMFAGSGIAGSMMIKQLAYPLLRPVSKDGWSTYWAVILAPYGAVKFDGKSYFKGKKIIYCSLASSGEFFARLFIGEKQEIVRAASHGAAIHDLSKGIADIAVVKNRVWDSEQTKYPNIVKVGEDFGQNPNGTLIVSFSARKKLIEKINKILLGIENDNSIVAKEVKNSLKIIKYIPTTKVDFAHTLNLLKRVGVTKEFNFKY